MTDDELLRHVIPKGWEVIHRTDDISVTAPDGYQYRIYPNPNKNVGGWFLEGEHRTRPAIYALPKSALQAAIIDYDTRPLEEDPDA